MLTIAAVLLAGTLTPTSTLCKTSEVTVSTKTKNRKLDGCGGDATVNLLWNLDRSDSISGNLDGRVFRRTTGKGAVVYVCDTGVKASHDEFARDGGSNVIAGLDLIASSNDKCTSANYASDPCWPEGADGQLFVFTHGTAVGSVIAGTNVGIAPDAKLVAVRIAGGTTAQWANAFNAIIKHAFDPATPPFRTAVINMSAGVSMKSEPALEALIRKMIGGVDQDGNPDAKGKRFLFVSAAGNSQPRDTNGDPFGCNKDLTVNTFPSTLGRAIDGLVTVGGLAKDNTFWSGSCIGSAIDVIAPAEDIFTASLGGADQYRYLPLDGNSGTSYSTPYVSGMAARILEENPDLTPAEIEAKLKASLSYVAGYAVPIDPLPAPPRRRALH
jgi:subtilisin family serine protease